MGITEKSSSPYASPLVICKKPDGSDRYCVDLRLINQKTVFDAEPIPDQGGNLCKTSQRSLFYQN